MPRIPKQRSWQEVIKILGKLSDDYNQKSASLREEFLKVAQNAQKLLDEIQVEKIKKNLKKNT